MPQTLASKLRGIGVITDRGLQIGQLSDMLIDETNGKILSLVVKPVGKEVLKDLPKDESGSSLVPFETVMAIRDFIVVNERVLAIQRLKTKPA